MYTYKIGDKVKHTCDEDSFEVVGLRNGELEIKGDWSGGAWPCNEAAWVPINDVEPYDKTKIVIYVDGKPFKNGKPL